MVVAGTGWIAGIHYPPATDLVGGRSPIVEGDHWSGVAGKTVVTQTHRRTTPHSLDLFERIYSLSEPCMNEERKRKTNLNSRNKAVFTLIFEIAKMW